jgi:hypothetical protein
MHGALCVILGRANHAACPIGRDRALLADCFGLADAPLATAVATLQRKPS